MPPQAKIVELRLMWAILCVPLTCSALSGCGDDSGPANTMDAGGRDGGANDGGYVRPDGGGVRPPRPRIDAAVIAGDPPEELESENCAVDTNKLYEVATTDRAPEPSQVAVDQVGSRFGLVYVDKSDTCFDAVYLTTLSGPSNVGEPSVSMAVDPCAMIERAALTRTKSSWLIATVDGRMGAGSVWVQAYDGKKTLTAYNITESPGEKTELAITALSADAAIVSWVEVALDSMGILSNSLHVRVLSSKGEPTADEVELEPLGTYSIAGLSLAQTSSSFVALGYWRNGTDGTSEIVLDVLDTVTGERDRDPWVVSPTAGTRGSVDVSADDEGGGMVYSFGDRTAHQLWFQQLGTDGSAALVMSGASVGGPAEPSRIVGAPRNAVDASIAILPGTGFAVIYRSLPGPGLTEPRIHLELLGVNGGQKGGSDIALANEYGGRTTIETGFDGRMVVAWSDTSEDGLTKSTAVKLPCFGAL
jgi:hypothetical protein